MLLDSYTAPSFPRPVDSHLYLNREACLLDDSTSSLQAADVLCTVAACHGTPPLWCSVKQGGGGKVSILTAQKQQQQQQHYNKNILINHRWASKPRLCFKYSFCLVGHHGSHTYNASTWEVGARGLIQVWGQPRSHFKANIDYSDILFPK